jgi:catechol 2,3-dioxygenase-like lactoylglutathione lyase family enzyme
MPTIASMTPLLQVFDMPRAVAFYRDKLGFAVVAHSPEIESAEGRYFHWCTLRRDGAQLMLNTAYDEGERPSGRDEARWAGHAHTVLFVDCPELDAFREELRVRGLDIPPPQTSTYGMRQIEVTDPDGYELCFQCPA